MLWLAIVAACAIGAYLLFKDTMNRIQYLQSVRLYWITRNNGVRGTRVITRAFMRQTAPPWWRGTGIQFRAGRYTFQIGVLTGRASNLLDQVDGRDMDVATAELRNWGKNG